MGHIVTLLNFVFATQMVANAFSASSSTFIPRPDMHIEEVNMLSTQGGKL